MTLPYCFKGSCSVSCPGNVPGMTAATHYTAAGKDLLRDACENDSLGTTDGLFARRHVSSSGGAIRPSGSVVRDKENWQQPSTARIRTYPGKTGDLTPSGIVENRRVLMSRHVSVKRVFSGGVVVSKQPGLYA